ncbi:hypothetical protein CEXT_158911 [Caerostris extrusa]|uniref:Uncharacterized protein n=1 Tax=Caerostris extrusa TaxID=172846 RepID=A0AAV4MU75_CAEEX|nr:hypothetical protein CEXT_158911 [Caerostris extrusa]
MPPAFGSGFRATGETSISCSTECGELRAASAHQGPARTARCQTTVRQSRRHEKSSSGPMGAHLTGNRATPSLQHGSSTRLASFVFELR